MQGRLRETPCPLTRRGRRRLRAPGVDRTSALTRPLSLGVARGLLHDALPTGDTAGADAAMAAPAEMALPTQDALDKLL